MATGYEVKMYADIARIANALERIANQHSPAPQPARMSDTTTRNLRDAARALRDTDFRLAGREQPVVVEAVIATIQQAIEDEGTA